MAGRFLEHGLPQHGHVLIGNPADANKAKVIAEHKGLDYTLSVYVREGECFIVDCDRIVRDDRGVLHLKDPDHPE